MTALSSAGSSAQRVAHNDKMRGLARLGLAAHGALYVLLGVLALVLAFGGRKGETDQKGAFQNWRRTRPAGCCCSSSRSG